MRSHTDACVRTVAIVLLALAGTSAAAPIAREPVRTQDERFEPAEIAGALAKVKADPNLATERTIKTLRWNDRGDQKPGAIPAWLTWIAGLFAWLAQSARLLVWGAVLAGAGVLVVYLVRLWRTAGVPRAEERFVAPTHVRDLDIRPETLPANIGAAARALWDRREHRAALALLYRGLLSRLAHVHRVPIRDSSTEGECLALAAGHLTPRRTDYAGRVIQVWQRAVYGSEEIQPAVVYALCDDFAPFLDRSSANASSAPAGPR